MLRCLEIKLYTLKLPLEQSRNLKNFKSKFENVWSLIPKYDIFKLLECNRSLTWKGFPGGSDSKESACIVGDLGLIPGSG